MPQKVPIEHRFWGKVAKGKPEECWEWTAATNALGYGIIGLNGGSVLAHRVSWELTQAEGPGELCVLHRCDNPPCVNPARADNAADRDRKGRQARGERMAPARLSEADVYEIHGLYSSGVSIPKVAEALNLRKGTVEAVVSGRSWMHLGLKWETRPGRLNPDRVRDIRHRFAAGENRHTIAADYRISPKTVNEVVSRRNWASVA